jgi:hypothetical protein
MVPVSPEQEEEIHAWKRALASRLDQESSASSMRFMQTLRRGEAGGTIRTETRALGVTRGRQRGAWAGGSRATSAIACPGSTHLQTRTEIGKKAKTNSVPPFLVAPSLPAKLVAPINLGCPGIGAKRRQNASRSRSETVRVGFRAVFKSPLRRVGRKDPRATTPSRRSGCRRRPPRRAFVTLVRDALASANASRLARPLHAKVKVQPPQHHPSADPAYRFAEPTRSADAPAPLASWRGASTTWRDGRRARGASKLPSFRFPEALSATDTTERGGVRLGRRFRVLARGLPRG